MLSQVESAQAPEGRLSGTIFPDEFYRFVDRDGFDPAVVLDVLEGRVAGGIFLGAVDQSACRRITQNFWQHPQRRQRDDSVPAHIVGTYHYGKSLDAYFVDAAAAREGLPALFAGAPDVFDEVRGRLAATLAARGVSMRLAEHDGRQAAAFVMRSWSGAGVFALEPHEDGAQLGQSQQTGFEIQRVADFPLVAANICLENPGAGHLHYWNIEPSPEARAALGLAETGYPYPLGVLEGIPRLILPVGRGDVYFFNGRLIHAVASQDGMAGYRTTISCLMGFRDPQTVIYWA